MNRTYSTLNAIFYIGLAISFIIFLLPPEYKMAVYTPNMLGLFDTFICLPVTLLTFIWLGIHDLRHGTRRKLAIRTITLVSILLFATWYWFYIVLK